jgi:hypothetical protein
MMPVPPSLHALRTAFDVSFAIISPERQEAVLRQALLSMLDAGMPPPVTAPTTTRRSPSPSPSAAKRSPRIDGADWDTLRARLRGELRARGMTIAALAKEARLARWTVAHALTPHGRAPGASTARRLQRWLADTHTAGLDVGAAEVAVIPAGPPAEPPAPPDIDGVMPRHLSQAQRDRLGGYLGFGGKEVRDLLGVSKEIAEKAFHGQELAAEIVGRIATALDGAEAG